MAITEEEIKEAFIQAMTDPRVSSLFTGSPPTPPGGPTPPPPDRSTRYTDPGTPDDDSDIDRTLTERANKVSANLTGVFGAGMTGITQAITIALDAVGEYNEELDKEVSYFRYIQENFGGISEAAYAAGEAVGGITGQALEAVQHLGLVGSNGKDSLLEIESGALKGKNALIELFKEPEEASKIFRDVLMDVAETNITLSKSLKDQGKEEAERIAVLSKRMGIQSNEMGNILRRQFAFTGEASSKIIEDIANVAVTVAETTGGSAEDLKDDIMDIMQDTKRFGDIGVDSAARIAGALNQLGLDFQTFQGITDQFMNFDSAAQKMGDLSALFGIQMDAMEMTYLANEDQEEFLFRMREEILDAGLDVENMSKTRQRALTDQLGLQSIEQMRQFMDTGIQPDQMALEAATTQAETMDGLATGIEKFGGAYEGAYKGAEQFEKSLRMQATFSDEVTRNIIATRKETGQLPGIALGKIRLSQKAIDTAIVSLQQTKVLVTDIATDGVAKISEFINASGEMAASATNTALGSLGFTKKSLVPSSPAEQEAKTSVSSTYIKSTTDLLNTFVAENNKTLAKESQQQEQTNKWLEMMSKKDPTVTLNPTTNVTIDPGGLVRSGIYQIQNEDGVVYATTPQT